MAARKRISTTAGAGKTKGRRRKTAVDGAAKTLPAVDYETAAAEAWPLEERLRDLRRIFSTPFTEVEGTDLHQGIGRYGAVMPCKLKALELYSRLVGDLKGRTAGSAETAAEDEDGRDELTRMLEGIVQ